MIFQLLIILLSIGTSQSTPFTSSRDYSSTYHYSNNISLKNFDGSRSTINVNSNSATLLNSDGTQSTISFSGNSSTLIAIDGTSSSIFHNGSTSSVYNSDGTQLFVNHMQTTSSCYTDAGKHMITHTFGESKERRIKDKIDVLIHMNWVVLKRQKMAQEELTKDN